MKKIAVFASGGGTDFQSVIDANEREQFCVIEYLVASKPEIGAISRAEKHGIKPLVYDKNLNGIVDSGIELFGDQNGAINGYEELKKYDDDNDGYITEKDTIYVQLQLWCDKNKNGLTDKGELHTLSEENVVSISVKYDTLKDNQGNIKKDEHGNIIGYVGSFVQKVFDAAKNAWDFVVGKTMDAIFQYID